MSWKLSHVRVGNVYKSNSDSFAITKSEFSDSFNGGKLIMNFSGISLRADGESENVNLE